MIKAFNSTVVVLPSVFSLSNNCCTSFKITIKSSVVKIFLPIIVLLLSVFSAGAAEIYFNDVYQGVRNNLVPFYSTNSSSIAIGAKYPFRNFRFRSVDPAAVTFPGIAGNDVVGLLVFDDENGVERPAIPGIISRLSKSGGSYRAFYFYETNDLGNETGNAYLLVVVGNEAFYEQLGGAVTPDAKTSSDPIDNALNNLLLNQPRLLDLGNLNVFVSCSGGASATQALSVSGLNLTANVLFTAPTGFEVSTSNTGPFASSLTLAPSTGTVSSTVYARLTSDAVDGVSGTFILTSTGAATIFVSAPPSTVNPLPVLTASAIPPVVCADSAISLSVTNTIGTISSSIWTGPGISGSSASQTVTLTDAQTNASGTYSVTVVDAKGCTSSASTTVLVNPNPVLSITLSPVSAVVCSGESISLTVSNTIGTISSSIWSGPGISGSSAGPSVTLTDAQTNASGTYSVIVVDANGCTSSTSTNVLVNPLPEPVITFSNATNNLCLGSSVDVSVSPSLTGYTFSWSGPASFSSQQSLFSLNNLATANEGTYAVVVTDPNGCAATATASLDVKELPGITITASPSLEICEGSGLALTAVSNTASLTYNWVTPSMGSFGASLYILNSSTSSDAGVYTLTVTDNNNCSNQATATVVVNPKPSFLVNDASVCSMGTVTITLNTTLSSGSGVWTLSGSGTNTSTSAIGSITEGGLYTAPESEEQLIDVLYKYTDTKGCTASDAAQISVRPLPKINGAAADFPVCAGGTVALTVDAGTATITTIWEKLSGGGSVSGASYTAPGTAGTAVVQVAISNQYCTTTSTRTIIINPLPVITASVSSPVTACEGDDLQLTASNLTYSTYQWTGPNGFTSALSAPKVVNTTQASAGIYTLTVTDSNGCSSTTSVSVQVNVLPSVLSVLDGLRSGTGSVTLSATPSTGATIDWYKEPGGSNGALSTGSTNFATPSLSTTTDYHVEARDLTTGCVSATRARVVAIISGSVDPGDIQTEQTVCGPLTNLTLTELEEASIDVDAGPFTYKWYASTVSATTGFVLIGTSTSTSFDVSGNSGAITQTTWYYREALTTTTGIDAKTVSNSSDVIKITINPVPAVPSFTYSGTASICQGENLTLSVSSPVGGITYQWLRGGVDIPNATGNTFAATLSGTYSLRATNTSSCSASSSNTVDLVVNPLPGTPSITVVGGKQTFCEGSSVTLTATPGATSYFWYRTPTGGARSLVQSGSSSAYTATLEGFYTVVVDNVFSCTSESSASVFLDSKPNPSKPVLTAQGPTTVCEGSSVVVEAASNPATNYTWYRNNQLLVSSAATSLTATQSGSYTVQSSNDAGCISPLSETFTVTVNPIPAIPQIIATGQTTLCQGNNVSLSSSVSGTSYQWLNGPSGTTAIAGATSPTYIASTTGLYNVRVGNAFNCFSTSATPVNVVVNSLPAKPSIIVIGSRPTTFCAGDSVVLESTRGSSYIWYRNGVLIDNAVSDKYTAKVSGTYRVVVTNNQGCISVNSDGVQVTRNELPAQPSITSADPLTFCPGSSATLTSTQSAAYAWFKNGSSLTGINTQSYVATQTGTYTVIVTNDNGCVSAASSGTLVSFHPVPSTPGISTGGVATVLCDGESLTLSYGSTLAPQWFKDGVAIASTSGNTLVVTSTGNYSVVVTNPEGCKSDESDAVDVVFNALPAIPTLSVVGTGTTTFCLGQNVVLSSSPATAYQWYNGLTPISGATAQTYTVTATGDYKVVVTNSAGCSRTASTSIKVTVNPLPETPVLSSSAGLTFCDKESTTLSANMTASSFRWYRNNILQRDSLREDYVVRSGAKFRVEAVNGFGCISASSNEIEVVVKPLPSFTLEIAVCQGNEIQLTGSGVPAAVDPWKSSDTSIATVSNSGLLIALKTGNVMISYTDSTGCTLTRDIDVNVAPATPGTIFGPEVVAPGANVIYTAPQVIGATNYIWNFPAGWTASSDGNTTTVTPGSSSGFVTIIASTNGCNSDTTIILITVDTTDTDKDGIYDVIDLDDDNDGILDVVENAACDPASPDCDTDGDGVPNRIDLDSDGDRLSDVVESNGLDADGDGMVDGPVDVVGVPINANGGLTPPDTDGDGKLNPYDVDSDGDGIPDEVEGIKDTDGDGVPDYLDLDSDGDGIPDAVEAGPNPDKPRDTDGDGIPDYLDLDSDGDGIPDKTEAGTDPTKPRDTDKDGIPDFLDLDSDNDGITDKAENGNGPSELDTDKDGIPDYLDLDSDGDLISDVTEADGTDANKDGIADGDVDANGVPISANGGLNPPDTDKDGTRDFQDVDSDGDGIPDRVEAGRDPKTPVDTDKDGVPDYRDLDSDGDGIPDSVERGADGTKPVDTDADGLPDYIDLDSDGDTIPDAVEAVVGNSDPKTPVDTDNDGVPDYRDVDSDGDGIPDRVEAGPNPRIPVDTDRDGIPDFRDLDSDGDGIPDSVERGADGSKPVDTDNDGVPDYKDLDSDGDTIPDAVEAVLGNSDPKTPIDTDKDGTPDYRDTDTDGDTIPDIDETGPNPSNPVDTDGDGVPDFRDVDSNNDGVPDGETLLIWKKATAGKPVGTLGEMEITFTLILTNVRPEPISNVQIQEDLRKTFPSPMTFAVKLVESKGILIPNPGFNGSSDVNMLASGIVLPGNSQDSIKFTVRFDPKLFSGEILNIAVGSAITKWGPVTRESIDIVNSNGRKHGPGDPTESTIPLVDIVTPDIITPNGDGFNDVLIIQRPSTVNISLTVFNRWGQLVYKNTNYRNDWNGVSLNGTPLAQGTYYYIAELTGPTITGKEVKKNYLSIKRNY